MTTYVDYCRRAKLDSSAFLAVAILSLVCRLIAAHAVFGSWGKVNRRPMVFFD
jgi:hypothetical protein